MKKIYTLSIPYKHPQVLLGMKKRGFGAGRWNGFGGKVKEGETIETAACRELKEEAGIDVKEKEIEKVGILDFEIRSDSKFLEVHVFRVHDFEGEPVESEEMKPQWFNVNEAPFDVMWLDDKYWFPLLFQRKKFKGRFLFEDDTKLLDKQLIEVTSL